MSLYWYLGMNKDFKLFKCKFGGYVLLQTSKTRHLSPRNCELKIYPNTPWVVSYIFKSWAGISMSMAVYGDLA